MKISYKATDIPDCGSLPRVNLPLFSQHNVLLVFEITSPSVMNTMHTINLELPVRNTMRRINLELPDGLHERIHALAKKNKVSINLLVATALAGTILTPHTEQYFGERNQKNQVSYI